MASAGQGWEEHANRAIDGLGVPFAMITEFNIFAESLVSRPAATIGFLFGRFALPAHPLSYEIINKFKYIT